MPMQYYEDGGPVDYQGISSMARDLYMPQGVLDNLMQSDENILEGLQQLREENPQAFQEMMDRNTQANIDRLNRLQFDSEQVYEGSPIPGVDAYLTDRAAYSTQVAPGFESQDYIEKSDTAVTEGVNIPGRGSRLTERTLVPGISGEGDLNRTILHETAHTTLPQEGAMERLMQASEMSEEAGVSGMDLYRAVKRGDIDEVRSRLAYLGRQGVYPVNPLQIRGLRDNIVNRIMYFSQQSGVPVDQKELENDVYGALKAAAREQDRQFQERNAQNYARGGGVASLAPSVHRMFRS